jgi:hypothetical protein
VKRVGVIIARPRVVVDATRFATGVLPTSIFDSTSFRLPLLIFVEAFKALEASLIALLAIAFALRASISAFRIVAFSLRSKALRSFSILAS